ncbi:MAG: hypothetical protein J4F49_13780 [Rhodobacteraceae bacterium]|nr:hypothetical protein [Paracoccaceae bacterium]
MEDSSDPIKAPPTVRWLKIMVTALTVTTIAGFTTIVVLFVIKFREFSAPPILELPGSISLPGGSSAVAFTQGLTWFAVVTKNDEILIFDRNGGELIRRIDIID